eukprot:366332-Chlamydomonas_euryale.AAC.17
MTATSGLALARSTRNSALGLRSSCSYRSACTSCAHAAGEGGGSETFEAALSCAERFVGLGSELRTRGAQHAQQHAQPTRAAARVRSARRAFAQQHARWCVHFGTESLVSRKYREHGWGAFCSLLSPHQDFMQAC